MVVGKSLGNIEGRFVGMAVMEGYVEGTEEMLGVELGPFDGILLGSDVGEVGCGVKVGTVDGALVGITEDEGIGVTVGLSEGAGDGFGDSVGREEGSGDGASTIVGVGDGLGESVGVKLEIFFSFRAVLLPLLCVDDKSNECPY
mmetsp:Transcript_25722/g.29388  ORF Transcript_25722/g.29388 Transcript_25722/m.29388 type:complete len:144 (-) Transcript_25722:33-464(-)